MRMSTRRTFRLALVLALALPGPVSGASRWKKPYFKATPPGSWARTRMVNTVNGDVTENTSRRLPDEDGRVVLETSFEITSGQFKGTKSVSRSVMKAGFLFETEGLSYMRWVEKLKSTGGEGQEFEMDAETVRIVAADALDYGALVAFKGTETVDGKACDRYAWSYVDPALGKRDGEYWLSDQVPFAVVKEVSSGTDATKTPYRFESRLVESGVGKAPARAARPGAEAAPATLVDLYKAGKVSVQVDVVPLSAKVRVTIRNSGDGALDVVVPKGTTTLANDVPVRELVLVSDAERKLRVPAGGAAPPFEMTQKGSYRPTKGSFTLSVYEGTPLFSGSVEMGPAKE